MLRKCNCLKPNIHKKQLKDTSRVDTFLRSRNLAQAMLEGMSRVDQLKIDKSIIDKSSLNVNFYYESYIYSSHFAFCYQYDLNPS